MSAQCGNVLSRWILLVGRPWNPYFQAFPAVSLSPSCNIRVDLYPTLIDLCGLPEKTLDGKSIKPLLKNPDLEWEPTLTTQDKGNHSVISERWHYITHSRGVEEVYDLENDPMEWDNMVQSNPEKAKAVIEMLKAYLPDQEAEGIPKRTKNKGGK